MKKLLQFFTFLTILIGIFMVWLYSAEFTYFILNQEDYLSVSNVFLLALSENNIEILETLVSEDNHEFLTNWVENHVARGCSRIPGIPGFDAPTFGGVSGLRDDGMKGTVQWTMYIPCPDDQNLYCLVVENLELIKTSDNSWKIQGWDDIYEYEAQNSCG